MAFKVKVGPNGTMPVRMSAGAAGYDIAASEAWTIPANTRSLIKTDLFFSFPNDMVGRLCPRSSLATKGIDLAAGVIDSDYRGEVKVLLVNTSSFDFRIEKGDRIAQLVFMRIACPEPVPTTDLDETNRGTGGFGSTGI